MTTNIDLDAARRRYEWNPDNDSGAPPEARNANEAADRAAASLRYDDLIASGAGSGECQAAPPAPAPTEAVQHPVLFTRERGDATAVDPHDVLQGNLADCFVLATLGALANTPKGQALIQNAITENVDKAGNVSSYTVKLYRPESHLGGLGKTTFEPVEVTVSATYVTDRAQARPNAGLAEVWPLVMEKAYAQYVGGYENLRSGGRPRDVMEVVTGKPATQTSLRFFGNYGAKQLTSDLAAGKIITFDTRTGIDGDPNAHDLVGDHAYVVTGTQEVGGKLCATLYNPWGAAQPSPVPVDEIKRWFVAVDVGSVP